MKLLDKILKPLAPLRLKLYQNQPKILIISGGVLGVLAVADAVYVGTKLEPTVRQGHNEIQKIKMDPEYYGDEYDKTLLKARARFALRIAKLFSGIIVLSGGSIICLTKGATQYDKRFMGLMGAYNVMANGYETLYNRIVEKYGAEEARNLRLGTHPVDALVTDEDGNENQTSVMVAQTSPAQNPALLYGRYLDADTSHLFDRTWYRHPDYMEKQLQGIEVALTEILLTRGWLLLNEAYDMLGLPRSAAGCIVGWRLSHDGSTDNHVSLGLDKLPSDWKRQMRLGTMWSIFINPNVDGPILDAITDTEKREYFDVVQAN